MLKYKSITIATCQNFPLFVNCVMNNLRVDVDLLIISDPTVYFSIFVNFVKRHLNGNISWKKHESSVHIGEKVSCKECGRTVSDKNNLQRHIQNVHLKTRKYSCNQCEKFYFWKKALDMHKERIHDNKYNCNTCDFQSTTVSHIKRHKESVHEGIRYECHLCEGKFKEKGSLRKHIESIHNLKKYQISSLARKIRMWHMWPQDISKK